jgi:uncharacterized membrane protein
VGTTRKDMLFVLFLALLTAGLALLPSGFGGRSEGTGGAEREKALILQTDDSNMRQFGIVRTGDQGLTIRVLSGRFAGQELEAVNHLMGRLELDKVFAPGDKAFVVLDPDESGNAIAKANVLDFYRMDIELVVLVLFSLFLLVFAGWTGAKALLSFLFTALMIWKVFLPGMLRGWDPVLTSLGVVAALTAAIILLVGGMNRRGAVAFAGSMAGIGITCVLALVFGSAFRIHGAVKPFSETLLYSGFAHLDLTKIFLGGIFLASSGAVMDLAMDVAAAMTEIRSKNPNITRKELVLSGFSVGRAVVGTMTTTLLLAYTGSYASLLMAFIAQGVPLANILNMQYVAAEILNTLVGSFGLVTVAPLTALAGGLLLVGK